MGFDLSPPAFFSSAAGSVPALFCGNGAVFLLLQKSPFTKDEKKEKSDKSFHDKKRTIRAGRKKYLFVYAIMKKPKEGISGQRIS